MSIRLHSANLSDLAASVLKKVPDSFWETMRGMKFWHNTINTLEIGKIMERDRGRPCGVAINFLASKWHVGPHTDPMFPRWSHFLVLQNDGMAVCTMETIENDEDPRRFQPPGTVFSLDVHQPHWVSPRFVGNEAQPYFVAMCFEGPDLLPEEVIVRRFRAAASELLGLT